MERSTVRSGTYSAAAPAPVPAAALETATFALG